ncbi:MAG: diguanylate cyclase, partial [Dehalococcoidia bacterium]|nr:diguanylate cyclase [Dehalococcoidia bacterium]
SATDRDADPLLAAPADRRPVLRAIAVALTASEPIAVVVARLNVLAEVHARHGYAVGDAVVVEAGRRLEGRLRAGDVWARLSADEFGVVLRGVRDTASVWGVAERLLAVASAPYRVGPYDIVAPVSIGARLVVDSRADPDTILRDAAAASAAAQRDTPPIRVADRASAEPLD